MGLFSKDIASMDDLFNHMQDIYYAERKIVRSLPSMIEKASDTGLRSGLGDHLDQTREHIARLEQVFDMIDMKAKAVDCPAIDGIIKEADDLVGEIEPNSVLDAAIIAAAQAVEHYEITRYGTIIAWANQLGRDDVAAVLKQTLREESAADEKLTQLAEAHVNADAAAAA